MSGQPGNQATSGPAAQLLREFSEKTGVAVELDGDGSASLTVDGVGVVAQFRAETEDVVVFALPLDDLQAEEPMMRRALELSAHGIGTDGFYLGMLDDAFVLSGVLPLDGLDAEAFAGALLRLAAASRSVASALLQAVADGVLEEGAPGGADDGNLFSLRV